MKIFNIFIFSFLSLNLCAQEIDLEYLRHQYPLSINDKEICNKIIEDLERKNLKDIELAYYGAFLAIRANHVSNPLDKLKAFKEGKLRIEEAVKSSPNQPEIRFIRLSIQQSIPAILGYHENIEQDRIFLKKHRSSIQSKQLNSMINELLNSQ